MPNINIHSTHSSEKYEQTGFESVTGMEAHSQSGTYNGTT